MRWGSKTLVVAAVVLLLAVGLGACGGGDSSSATTQAESQDRTGDSNGGASSNGKTQSDGREASGGENQGSGDSNGGSKNFTPKPHSDSGGGSQQFRVKGGDNSVQEFGEEAETSELDAAATTLHNFLDARAEGNWAAACDYMSKGIIASFEKLASQAQQVKGASCAGILEALTNPAAKGAMKAEAERADVGSLRIEDEQAFVIYTGTDGTILAMPMANEGGDWKVASLAGTPLN